MPHSSEFLKLAENARSHIHEVTIAELKAMAAEHKPFYLVDVREDNEWMQGHILGAVHMGKGVIERDIESVIPEKEACIVLYCGGGYRSALAAESVMKMGYKKVFSLAGGYRAWLSHQ